MKRFLLTLAVLMVSITAAFAEVLSGYCGTNVTYTLDTETGVLKIEGTGEMENYSSQQTFDRDYQSYIYITSAPWRNYYKYLSTVLISDGVTYIGNYAFYGCSFLTSATIPTSLKSIGVEAFSYCSRLTSITIPEGVTSIGNRAFYGCSSLTSITIPESLTYIGRFAFDNTGWYDQFPDGMVYVGLVAYKYKGNIPANTTVIINDGIKFICNYAFENCSSLTSITIPNSVTSIGGSAFYNCSSLTSITIPNSVTSIGSYAFSDCSSLTSITIPNSVISIGEYAFSDCI